LYTLVQPETPSQKQYWQHRTQLFGGTVGEEKQMDGNTMGWLAWIIVGGIAGWLASQVMHSSLGLVMDIVVGIVGAVIGGFLLNALGTSGVTGFNVWSVVVAFIGAVVLLAVVRLVSGRGRLAA
jgi:uncharacterized membrane protein YeaQ/YmgE (transglycosylase-associated protein family)